MNIIFSSSSECKLEEINGKKIKLQCDTCEYVTTRKDHLKRHRETKHEGIKYRCKKCDYTCTRSDKLRDVAKLKKLFKNYSNGEFWFHQECKMFLRT